MNREPDSYNVEGYYRIRGTLERQWCVWVRDIETLERAQQTKANGERRIAERNSQDGYSKLRIVAVYYEVIE